MISLLCMVISSWIADAQELKINPIKQSRINPIITNVYLYAAGGREHHSNLWTSNNTVYSNNHVYGKYVDMGAGVEIYKEKGLLQYCGTLGYKYQSYSYDKKLLDGYGVDTHWLSADIKAEILYVGTGFKTDFFLDAKIKNDDKFTYNGIYPECFNDISLCWYFALHLRFTRLKLEARIGTYIIPHLNANKITYHNMSKTHVDGLYFEFRLNYRIFTTGRPHNAPSVFD